MKRKSEDNSDAPESDDEHNLKQQLKQEAEQLHRMWKSLPDNIAVRSTLVLKECLDEHMGYLVGLFKSGSLLIDGEHCTLTGKLFGEGGAFENKNWKCDYELIEVWVETVLLKVCEGVYSRDANTICLLPMWEENTLLLLIKFTVNWLNDLSSVEHNKKAFELVLLTLDNAWGMLTFQWKFDKLNEDKLKMGMLSDVRDAITAFPEKPQ